MRNRSIVMEIIKTTKTFRGGVDKKFAEWIAEDDENFLQ